MAVEYDVVLADATGYVFLLRQINRLGNVADVADGAPLSQLPGEFDGCLLAHSVGNHVGSRVTEDTGAQPVLPIVVVRQAAHGRLNASQDDGHVGVELTENP